MKKFSITIALVLTMGNILSGCAKEPELTPKRLELLHEMAPKAARVAYLVNPANTANMLALKNVQSAAQKLGVRILAAEAGSPLRSTGRARHRVVPAWREDRLQ